MSRSGAEAELVLEKLSGDDELRRRAAEAALAAVEPGMKLGLGTGRTAEHFVRLLSVRVKEGLEVVGVPTSERTADLAKSGGIRLATLDDEPALDLTVDGADEVDRSLRLIKGGGGALLHEKIVATASRRMIVIVDSGKLVEVLGAFPLPIEVVPFGLTSTVRAIEAAAAGLGISGPIRLRTLANAPFRSDSGHFIVDAAFGRIDDPAALAEGLAGIPGVVEHGLFIDLASAVIVARANGIEWLSRTDGRT
jgi:ribose 5-phosphate isomerase A